MSSIEHFDKIHKLGFFIDIRWNEDISISYNGATTYFFDILNCSYDKGPYTFSDMIEVSCNLFYDWYNKNLDKIKYFDKENSPKSLSILEDSCLKDVSKQVSRELKLKEILDLIDKSKL